MPEFRQNMVSKEWVIIATERAKRPDNFVQKKEERKPLPPHKKDCPFCSGNESLTPPSLFSVEKNGVWSLRVVPNKFAALQSHLTTERKHEGRFLKADGFGIGEVVIETPSHHLTIATMDPVDVKNTVIAYKERYNALSKTGRIDLITIFRNYGERAGTSLEHPHSQIIATPIVPPHVRNPLYQSQLACDTFGDCIYCGMMEEERRQQARVVEETKYFLVVCPFASRSPFETRIYPKIHRSSFASISDVELIDFAFVLQDTLKRLYAGLNDPDYNYVIRSAPIEDSEVKYHHWYVVIVPKLTTPAGFEIGTGIYINATLPEQCAEFLRGVAIQ
ncbi:MAG: galactose-1-phosphate uridylyltransferase [Deltaproteobacteria bacterium RBG_16_49_23]|nr:MAG: galactose-1-phosphate uridylyltransferase [Deltaproteobacteria bacterium RBG_16_49_23]